ncbi:MAG: nuclear transport factor 2 family protein [Acidobacteria bacterium]|nr:nuclear transport factor 2 family protein [Acidobacteriota bacterium]
MRILKMAAMTCAAAAALVAVQAQQPTRLMPEDYTEIQQLYARYTHGFDTAADNGNMFADVFTPNGVLMNFDGMTYEGRAMLAELARRTSGGKGPTNATQFIYNVLVEPTPDGALGKSYVVIAQFSEPGESAAVSTGGQYHDMLVKTAEGWRIQRRTFVRAINYPTTAPR